MVVKFGKIFIDNKARFNYRIVIVSVYLSKTDYLVHFWIIAMYGALDG